MKRNSKDQYGQPRLTGWTWLMEWVIAAVVAVLIVLFVYGVSNGISESEAATANTSVTVVIECTNENFESSPRCTAPVEWVLGDDYYGYYGELTSGVTFRQGSIFDDRSVRIHKITVEQAFWYIDEFGAFEAPDDITALSIHLTRS